MLTHLWATLYILPLIFCLDVQFFESSPKKLNHCFSCPQNLMDVYFLSSQKSRPSLFGTPLMIPCTEETTNQELYQFVWSQISRLVSPLPPSESKTTNHALDWYFHLDFQLFHIYWQGF